MLRHAQFSRACCLKKSCISSSIFLKKRKGVEKKSAGKEKSQSKHIQFLFWFIALCNYNNQRALLWCADIQVQADLLSCHIVNVVTASCSLLIGACVCMRARVRAVFVCKHFIVQKWTCLGNECWCLQGGCTVEQNGCQPSMWLWDFSGVECESWRRSRSFLF